MRCRLYTKARRHELMVGKVGDIPVPAARWWQPVALLAAAAALWATRTLWWQLPIPWRVVLLFGALIGSWWGTGQFTANPFSSVAGLAVHLVDRARPAKSRKHRAPTRLVIRVPVIDDTPEETRDA